MNGWIMRLSSSYGGATNDLQIAIEELHERNHFEPTEQGMGDAGFQGTLTTTLFTHILNHHHKIWTIVSVLVNDK